MILILLISSSGGGKGYFYLYFCYWRASNRNSSRYKQGKFYTHWLFPKQKGNRKDQRWRKELATGGLERANITSWKCTRKQCKYNFEAVQSKWMKLEYANYIVNTELYAGLPKLLEVIRRRWRLRLAFFWDRATREWVHHDDLFNGNHHIAVGIGANQQEHKSTVYCRTRFVMRRKWNIA